MKETAIYNIIDNYNGTLVHHYAFGYAHFTVDTVNIVVRLTGDPATSNMNFTVWALDIRNICNSASWNRVRGGVDRKLF